MEARKFRYLFENTDDGIVHSGCIWDTMTDQCTNYAYVCGIRNQRGIQVGRREQTFRFEQTGGLCHIFVLGSFSVRYIKILLKLVRRQRLETVLLPYTTPLQRLAILQWCGDEIRKEPGFKELMEAPYTFLKNAGVKNVYLIYGNGEIWKGEPHQLMSGHHFELVDNGDLQRIKEMEGHYVPVVKAGYMIVNKWLFYFGYYGREQSFVEGTGGFLSRNRSLFQYREPEWKQLEPWKSASDDIRQWEEMIPVSLTMFQTPLDSGPQSVDSVMMGKVFDASMSCLPYFRREERNCLLSCTHQEDHDIYRKHKAQTRRMGCFGTLSVGNVNMNRYFPEFMNRFRTILPQVRAITLPGCGNRDYWNRQCLTILMGEDIKYWLCALDTATSPAVISDVVVASPMNRLVMLSEEYGHCFSGYLIPHVEGES